MTEQTNAALAAAEAELARAKAQAALADQPHLEAALAALSPEGLGAVEAELKAAHAEIGDAEARQAIANVWMIAASARQLLRSRHAAALQAIAAAEDVA